MADVRGDEGVGVRILLPSSYSKSDRTKCGLDRLADLESKVREADAYDALHSLKLDLREIVYQVSRFGKDGYGKKNNTRSVSAQKDAHKRKRQHAARYRRARCALVALGLDERSSSLWPLTDEDMYRPALHEPHELGSGKKKAGWIWAIGHSGVKMKEWEQEGMF